VTHRGLGATADVATRAPAALDPDMTAAAALPATLLPDVAGALALPVAIPPDPASAVVRPAALDPDETRTRGRHHDDARRRWFLFDLDVRDRCGDVAVGTHDAARAQRQRCDERHASE